MTIKPSKILVVDDDLRLRILLSRHLTEQGFAVLAVTDGTSKDRAMDRERYDLLVLDLMLQGENGLDICKRLRGSDNDIQILMLTAKGDDMDHIIEPFLTYIRDGEIETVRQADLNELVQATASRYQRQGHSLALNLMPLPAFPLRAVAIQRMLANLIDNALNHGGGEVEVRTQVVDGKISLSVLDRGRGLPLPQQENHTIAYRAHLGHILGTSWTHRG